MRDLRDALALARERVLESSGNTGNSGNASENVTQKRHLPDLHPVSSAVDAVATVETGSADVATVSSAPALVETVPLSIKPNSGQALTQAAASVSTVSSENSTELDGWDEQSWWDDVMATAERSAILENDAGMPRDCADALATLIQAPPPKGIEATSWQTISDRALTFSDTWASEAHRLGWRAEELFKFDGQAHTGNERGLAFILSSEDQVVAIDADGADILTASGARQRFNRRREAA